MKLSLFALALAALPVAVGCAAPSGEPTESAVGEVTSSIPGGSYKLYGEPFATPSVFCDVHTALSIVGGKAHLREALDGNCRLFVQPNPRSYELKDGGTSCGSRIYTASVKQGVESWSLKITDNHSRICEDVIPGLIVVEETHDGPMGPMTTVRYSNDRPVDGQVVVFEGELAKQGPAIGGEGTGFLIQGRARSYELVLSPGEQNQFVPGMKAKIEGTYSPQDGVETRDRPAIDVTRMVVCPASNETINCTPGPTVRPSNLCAPENREWVEATCGGVTFVD